MKKLKFQEFIIMLQEKTKGRKIKSKNWNNYPNSTFYYWLDDDEMKNEIAIYTTDCAWGIYI